MPLSFSEFLDIEKFTPSDEEICEALGWYSDKKKKKLADHTPDEHLTRIKHLGGAMKKLVTKAATPPSASTPKSSGAWRDSHMALVSLYKRAQDRHLAHYLHKTKGREAAIKALGALKD